MTNWVYILQSETSGRYYCGQSSDVERRLRQHNDPAYSLSKTTKRFAGPWRLIWNRPCVDRGEAMRLERRIKKRGIERFLMDELNRRSPADGGINHQVAQVEGFAEIPPGAEFESCPGSHVIKAATHCGWPFLLCVIAPCLFSLCGKYLMSASAKNLDQFQQTYKRGRLQHEL